MFLYSLNVDSGSSSMWVEYRIASGFSLRWRHTLQINCVYWAWDIWFEMIQNQFLSLQWPHSFKRFCNNSDVEMILCSIQIDRLNLAIWNNIAYFFFQPFTGHHIPPEKGLCFEPLSPPNNNAEAKISKRYAMVSLF